MESEYLIVGSGLTGAVIARRLSDAGCKVVLLERRNHCGGNVHDHFHPSGIRIHSYGPHYFRTSSERIWNFVNRFGRFYRYEPSLLTLIHGRYQNWPVTQQYIDETVGPGWKPDFVGQPRNFEEASLAMMPKTIYEQFVKGYSEKQWGTDPRALEARLAGRFDVRADGDLRLKNHRFQGIPELGYAHFMTQLIAGIPTILNCDFLAHRSAFKARRLVVFTGPVDHYFDCKLGPLQYRGQRREHEYLPDTDWAQPCGQVNVPNPADGRHVRTMEWKHMMEPAVAAKIHGTVVSTETPFTPVDANDFEYPFPDEQNRNLAKRYLEMASLTPNLLVCGRLGEYRYYDMDQAIGRALVLADRILVAHSVEDSSRLLKETSEELRALSVLSDENLNIAIPDINERNH